MGARSSLLTTITEEHEAYSYGCENHSKGDYEDAKQWFLYCILLTKKASNSSYILKNSYKMLSYMHIDGCFGKQTQLDIRRGITYQLKAYEATKKGSFAHLIPIRWKNLHNFFMRYHVELLKEWIEKYPINEAKSSNVPLVKNEYFRQMKTSYVPLVKNERLQQMKTYNDLSFQNKMEKHIKERMEDQYQLYKKHVDDFVKGHGVLCSDMLSNLVNELSVDYYVDLNSIIWPPNETSCFHRIIYELVTSWKLEDEEPNLDLMVKKPWFPIVYV